MFDIKEFLFYDLLQFDRSSSVLTGNMQHDIVYGLLVPSIFLILILSFFSEEFIKDHKRMQLLVTVAALAVIVTNGWFATIAGLGQVLFPASIAVFMLKFFYRRVVGEKGSAAMIKGAGMAGKFAKERIGTKVEPPASSKTKRDIVFMISNAVREARLVREAYANATTGGLNSTTLNSARQVAAERDTKLSKDILSIIDYAEKNSGGIEFLKAEVTDASNWADPDGKYFKLSDNARDSEDIRARLQMV